jgi:hypothetical protein
VTDPPAQVLLVAVALGVQALDAIDKGAPGAGWLRMNAAEALAGAAADLWAGMDDPERMAWLDLQDRHSGGLGDVVRLCAARAAAPPADEGAPT